MNIKLKKITLYGMKVLTLLLSLFVVTQSAYADELSLCENNNINFKAYFQGGGKPALDWDTFVNSRSPYEKFVVELVNHVKAKLSNEPACDISAPAPVEISLTFVQRHMPDSLNYVDEAQKANDVSLESQTSSMVDFSCQLSSPWVKMAIQRSPNLKIIAIFNFEERQFVIDQTLLTYPNFADDFERQVLTNDSINQYQETHMKLYKPHSTVANPSPEVEQNIPMDLLWLFNNYNRSRSIYSLVGHLVYKQRAEYTKVYKALFNQCFSSENNQVQSFNTILNLENLNDYLSLENYKYK